MTSFFDHTLNWINGEILEGISFGIVGALIILASELLWKFGSSEAARALIMPMLMIGILLTSMSIAGVYNNYQRKFDYAELHQQSEQAFITQEKNRVENFMTWYKYTIGFGILLMITGTALFLLLSSHKVQAIALSMIFLGMAALYIDHFSKARAAIYLDQINKFSL